MPIQVTKLLDFGLGVAILPHVWHSTDWINIEQIRITYLWLFMFKNEKTMMMMMKMMIIIHVDNKSIIYYMKDKYLAATDHFASGPPCNGKKSVSQILPKPIISVESEWRVWFAWLLGKSWPNNSQNQTIHLWCGVFQNMVMVLMVTFVMGATWKTVQYIGGDWGTRTVFWSPCLAKILF